MAKGSTFERSICAELSAWWTGDPNASVFWRTAGSGARATVRGKVNKQTAGHAGDVTATDPIAQPFMRFVTLELKRGYGTKTPFDLLDRPAHHNKQVWEEWINQAIRSAKLAGSAHWMVIHRRDKRQTYCVFPQKMWRQILGGESFLPTPAAPMHLRTIMKVDGVESRMLMVIMPFSDFLEQVSPDTIRQLETA